MDMTTANPQSLSPHSLILLDPFDSVPSTSQPLPPLLRARLVLAPNSIRLLDCPWVGWKFIYSNLCYFEMWLFRELHRTWEENAVCMFFASRGFSPSRHISLCFIKVGEFWFSSGINLLLSCVLVRRKGYLLLEWLEKINESFHKPHRKANICLAKHSYSNTF